MLTSDNLRLRALEPEDLGLLYQWENDATLWQHGSTVSPFSRYVLKQYIADSHQSIYELHQQRLMIDWLPTAQTVGMIDLFDFDPHHRRAALGILIDPAYQRRGIATEAVRLVKEYAFEFLRLHQLYIHVRSDNRASIALFLQNGFRQNGVLSQWVATPEGYADVYVMQCFREQEAR